MSHRLRLSTVMLLAILGLAAGGTSVASAAPANDNFASAQLLSGPLPVAFAGNNIGATAQAGEPEIESIAVQKTVWYRFVAPATTTYVLNTCSDGFTGAPEYEDPLMGVYTGASLATLVSVADVNGSCSLRFPATIGTTYYLQVDYYEHEGSFILSLRQLTPPANDNFATPTVLGPALPTTVNATTVDSTWQAGEPASFGGTSDSRSVWFSFTPTASERVRLSLCSKTRVDGSLNDRTIVYTGNTLATLVQVAELTSSDCSVDFQVTSGTTYRIGTSGFIPGEYTFQLGLRAGIPPANDNFANAQVVGPALPIDTTGDNDFASVEVGEPDDHGDYPSGTSRSVWFNWTAGVTGRVRLKACSKDRQLFTSVYTGATLATLTEVSEFFYYAPCSRFFDAVAGTTYRIAVAGGPFEDTYGPFALNLHQVATPGNDAFENAVDLGAGLSVTREGTTVDATTQQNEPSHGSYGNDGGSVWYRWTAPNDQPVVFSACSQGEPNQITLYEDDPDPGPGQTGMNALRQIDYDSAACRAPGKGGRLAIAPEKGKAYTIVIVPAIEDFESAFTLRIEGNADPVVTPVPPKAGFNLKKAIAKCKKIKGKGAKAKRKRTRCIKAARKKAALIKCKKIENGKKRAKCEKSARKRFK